MPKNPSAKDAEDFTRALREFHEAIEAQNTVRDAYLAEEIRLDELFKEDLFYENVKIEGGIITEDVRKKANILYAKAWEDGHANGLYEVAMHFCNLVDLAKKLGVDI